MASPHFSPFRLPHDDWYAQLVGDGHKREFWTIQRGPLESLEAFVARFVELWKRAREYGITDREAAEHLIRLLPVDWRAWADVQFADTSYPHPSDSHPVGNFPSFVSRVFYRCVDPETAMPLSVLPPPDVPFSRLVVAPDATMTLHDVTPIPPPSTLPPRKRGLEHDAGPSGVPQDDRQRLMTLFQTLPAMEEQVGETPHIRPRTRARTTPADPIIPREFRIRLEEYGQPFALPPEDPAGLEDHFGSVPPAAPVVPTVPVPVIDVDGDEDSEEDPEEGSSAGSVRVP